MNLKHIRDILNQRLKLDMRQGIFYFKVQNGGEYLWFDDSYLGTKLYFEIIYSDPDFILSVGPKNGDKIASNHRDIEDLIVACQSLIDGIK